MLALRRDTARACGASGSRSANPPSFAGARVLVADDSAVNREVAMEALRRLGVEATLVADGQAAVDAAAAPRSISS